MIILYIMYFLFGYLIEISLLNHNRRVYGIKNITQHYHYIVHIATLPLSRRQTIEEYMVSRI
jgi:hypothetical protein